MQERRRADAVIFASTRVTVTVVQARFRFFVALFMVGTFHKRSAGILNKDKELNYGRNMHPGNIIT